jgi:zinc-ribbon domain
MFCPKCAAQNVEGASFCRVCGANISLVPQALTGQLPAVPPADDLEYRGGRRVRRNQSSTPPTMEKGIVNICMALGFVAAALAVLFRMPGGFAWGWCFFIPAFSMLGKGIAQIVGARNLAAGQQQRTIAGAPMFVPASLPPEARATAAEPVARRTGELVPTPPSVTEGTTRHLGAEAPTRHLDSSSEYPK